MSNKDQTVTIDGKEVPFVAVGNNEIPPELRDNYEKRTEELGKLKNPTSKDSLKLLSLVLSRGKTEEGRVVKCPKCKADYIVFPPEIEPEKKCSCGEKLQYPSEKS